MDRDSPYTLARFAWDPAVAADRAGHPAWGHAAEAPHVRLAQRHAQSPRAASAPPTWQRLRQLWQSALTGVRIHRGGQEHAPMPEPVHLGQ